MNREKISRVIDGRYLVIRLLGEGGLGKVFLTEDRLQGRKLLALKLLPKGSMTGEEVVHLKKEFQAMARLRHPGLARAFDFGTEASTGNHYMTREFVEGINLKEAAQQLPPESLPGLFLQICGTLQYMHSRGVYHHDLKPQNILVENCPPPNPRVIPRVKLLDFRLAGQDSAPVSVKSTVHYAPPEAFLGGTLDHRSDLYSLGVVFYEVLTGRLPFEDGKPIAVINAHLRKQPEPLRSLQPEIPRNLELIVLRLLEKDPGKRYSSSEELRQALASGYDRPAGFDPTGEAESYILSGSFVGRDRDLGALLSALGSLKEGSPSRPVAILVLGPAGIGKSRLVREFQHQVQMEEMPFFAGHCYQEGSSPAGPFLEILRHLWARAGDRGHPHRSRFGKHWQRLISNLPESSEESSQGEDRVEDPSAAQGKIPESIWGFIKDEATRGPMVLHLEDLQWADELSLDVLEAILRQGTGLPPLLLTATLEMDGEFTEPLAERFERIRNHPQVLCLPLPPLKREDVNRLVSSMLGTRQDVGRLAGLLNRLTGGNPLFIEEIMKGLVEEGSLKRVGERWRFDLDRIGQGIPRSIAEMISRRLESFGAEDREILEVLSTFHRPTEPGLIHEVMKAPLLEVRQRLDGLHRKGILERLDAGGGDPLYDFRHLQFRDIVYRDFKKDAKDLHRGIGRLLEDRSGKSALDRSEELAWHFAQAGDRARGLRYSMEAARKAEALNAKQQALGHFATTLKLLGRQQKPLRAEIFFRSGEIRQRLGDHPAAIRDFRKARALWSDLGDTASESATLERIAWSHGSTGQYDRAHRHALGALAMAERIDEPIVLGRTLNTLGMVFSRSGSFANALEYYQRARVLWEKEGDRKRTASTLNNMGLVCLFQGKREEGLENLMESLTIRKQLGDRGGQAQSMNNIGLCQRSMGRLEEAVRSFQECYRLAREVESTTDQATSLANQAETEIALGAYDSALETYEKAVALLEEMRNLHHLPTCLDGIGKAYFHLGDLASARSAHNRALEKARELDDRVQEGFALAALALDALHLDQAEEADELLSQARDLAEKLGNSRLRFQVLLVSRDFGRRNGDQEVLASVAQQMDRVAEESGLQNDRFQALHSRALVLMAAEKWDQAEGILAEAEGIGRELGLQEEQFEILAALAACASKQGKEDLAFQRYRTAAEAIGRIAERIRDRTSRERYLASPRRREAIRLAAAVEEGKLATEKVLPGTAILGSKTLLTLHDVSRAITSILSLNELLERIMDLAIELVGAERGLLFLKEQENDEMQIRVARSPDRETLKDATNYSKHVLKETEGGRSILAIDAGSDDRFRTFQSVSLYKIRSLMCVPLKYQDRILGTVYLDTRHTRKAFSEEDLRFLEIFAGQAAVAIENARLYTQLEKENQFLKRCVEERFQYHNIIGKSPSMRVVYDLLDRVADVNLPVLIQGESGTGKELVARAIHFNSSRKDRGFVTENCAALPENLLESELFGHVRGAFTGADRNKEGLFSLADGGTMFLDEIADMSLAMQSKLLRALQEGEIRPVGSTKTRRVDVRVLSATNRPPEELIREGKLRQDLYYRLSVVTIPLPPLRDRKEDIPLLCQHFLDRMAEANQRPPIQVSQEALNLLLRYSWPGNVRELENTLARLALFADDKITLRTLEQDRQTYDKLTDLVESHAGTPTLDEVEKKHILRVLDETGGDRTRAARALGISRATIFRKLKQYRLD